METDYSQLPEDQLSRESLLKNREFLSDALSFLEKRTGTKEFESDEEVLDKFMEHMRFHETNEVTAVRDLMYAQEADEESKKQFGNLLRTWDRMEGDPMSFNKAFDYVEAGFTSPSTWLGLVTGGAGKLASAGSTQAAKLGTRALVGSALKGMAVEGAIGLGTGAAQEEARVETGAQEEFTGGRTIATGVGQALAGALPATISGFQQGKAAERAMGLREAGETAMREAAEKGRKNAQAVIASVKNKDRVLQAKEQILTDEVKKAREFLDSTTGEVKKALDPEKVRQGTEILSQLSGTERTIAALDDETLDNLTAAAIKIGDELKAEPGERITSVVSRALEDGKLDIPKLDEILSDFNLNRDQFSYMYMADLSRAGRTLARASKIARETGMSTAQKAQRDTEKAMAEKRLDTLAKAFSDYMNQGGSGLTKQEAMQIAQDAAADTKVYNAVQDLDRFRLAMMTGQLATTVRNVAGGSFRVAVDAMNTMSRNTLHAIAGIAEGKSARELMENPASVANYLLFNQAEAKVVREMFQKNMPNEAGKFFATFFDNASASARLGGDTFLTRLGAKVNTLNRMSDNMYKQAIFAGRLDQLVRRDMNTTLSDLIAEGKFQTVSKDMIKDAIEESLDFVYQKTPTGSDVFSEGGRLLIDAHRKLPFVVSSFVPFPRFVINQFNFVAQHMPAIGLIAAKGLKKEAFTPDMLAKQVTGSAMLSMAYNLRQSQGPETEWYEYKTEDGKTIDMRPIAGPFNAFLLGADAIYRVKNGMEVKSGGGITKDMFQALGGPSFRAGTGLTALDRMVENLSGSGELGIKEQKAVATWVGDIVNTFTLPAATIRDLVSLTDEEARLVPETGYVDAFDIFAARATRSLPELSSIPVIGDYFEGVSSAEFISDTLGTGAVKLGTERADMITGEPLRSVDPLERQIFGTGKRAPKNELQKALTRLQMSPYDLYRPAEYPYEDRLLREAAGKRVAERLNSFVQSEEFLNMEPKLQKLAIAERAKEEINTVRKAVQERITTEQAAAAEKGESTEKDKFDFESLPKIRRDAAREAYRRQYDRDMGTDYRGALELLKPVEQRAKGFADGGAVTADTTEEDQLNPFAMTNGDMIINEENQADLEAAGEMAIEMGIGMLPVIGDVQDARDVITALKDEDYVGAALSSIGFIPLVGNVLKSGAKVTYDVIKEADPLVQRRALSEFVRQNGYMPDLSDADDLQILGKVAAKQEKILAGVSSSETPDILFHGSKTGRAPSPDIERRHAELGTTSLSTSRDPLYSAETFAKGDLENMYVVRPKPGTTANLSSAEYDQAIAVSKDPSAIGIPVGPLVEEAGLVTRLPKSMYTEAETIVQDIAGDVEISRLRDNPELFAKVQRGMDELDDTYNTFGEAAEIGFELRDAATANEFYKKVASGFKKAQGLGAYTSSAGARGTYDQILGKIAGDNPDFDGLINAMEESVELLTDNAGNLTQRGEKMSELVEALQELKAAQEFAGAREAAGEMRQFKEQIMDITNKMNRGGLATRRT